MRLPLSYIFFLPPRTFHTPEVSYLFRVWLISRPFSYDIHVFWIGARVIELVFVNHEVHLFLARVPSLIPYCPRDPSLECECPVASRGDIFNT